MAAKILEKIENYFFGNNILKFFDEQGDFYKARISDEKELEKRLKEIETDEMHYILGGKLLPNLVDIGAVLYSIWTGAMIMPSFIAGLAEGLRITRSEEFNFKEKYYLTDKSCILMDELMKKENIEKIVNILKNYRGLKEKDYKK